MHRLPVDDPHDSGDVGIVVMVKDELFEGVQRTIETHGLGVLLGLLRATSIRRTEVRLTPSLTEIWRLLTALAYSAAISLIRCATLCERVYEQPQLWTLSRGRCGAARVDLSG